MRLLGVTMVRNEADVIEAFVRHNHKKRNQERTAARRRATVLLA